MPRGDGTGPWGQGSMRGRGGGFCSGFGLPGHANRTPRRGFGWRGKGVGGGRGRGFDGTSMSRAEEARALRQQVEDFKACLKDIEHRLQAMESSGE